jgi:hypothetical protein
VQRIHIGLHLEHETREMRVVQRDGADTVARGAGPDDIRGTP